MIERKFKVGHGGTLDPLASGVLVIGVGRGCKALTGYLSGSKAYEATAQFGTAFDTLDCTGQIVKTAEIPEGLTEESFNALLQEKFTGEIMQRPPAFSAIRVNGQRAYDLARKHQESNNQDKTDENKDTVPLEDTPAPPTTGYPVLEARPVKIEGIRLLSWTLPEFRMEVECGGGTYIRSIIADAAEAVGCVAAMYGLVRTKQGPFALESCLDIESCADLDSLAAVMQPVQ